MEGIVLLVEKSHPANSTNDTNIRDTDSRTEGQEDKRGGGQDDTRIGV